MTERSEALWPDLAKAKANRERIERDENWEFWRLQARVCSGWAFGEPPPKGLILGELPYVGRLRRNIRDEQE